MVTGADGWTGAITLAIAVLGAALGIINTWGTLWEKRLNLKVRPAFAVTSAGVGFTIEVINLSAFPVTINEVGLLHGQSRGKLPSRIITSTGGTTDGRRFPTRLESRDALTVYFDVSQWQASNVRLSKAYALTSCKELAKGDSPALRQLSDELWTRSFREPAA